MYCNHYCNGFGKNCGYRTQDGYCALSPDIVYTDHTEQTEEKKEFEELKEKVKNLEERMKILYMDCKKQSGFNSLNQKYR